MVSIAHKNAVLETIVINFRSFFFLVYVTPGCFWHSGGVVISNKVRFFDNSRETLESAVNTGAQTLLYKIQSLLTISHRFLATKCVLTQK